MSISFLTLPSQKKKKEMEANSPPLVCGLDLVTHFQVTSETRS